MINNRQMKLMCGNKSCGAALRHFDKLSERSDRSRKLGVLSFESGVFETQNSELKTNH